jgi:hypothetical protein
MVDFPVGHVGPVEPPGAADVAGTDADHLAKLTVAGAKTFLNYILNYNSIG